MQNSKFFYLYLVAGILALISLVVKVVTTYPNVSYSSIAIKLFIAILLFYFAYKAYHEKKDQELM